MKDKTVKYIESYLGKLNKKLKSFRSRSPLFFTFQIYPSKITIQINDQFDIKDFNIDFKKSVEDLIFEIREYLRKEKYPKLLYLYQKNIEPDIIALNQATTEGKSFDQAIKELSIKTIEIEFTIDKLDIAKNKVVLFYDNKLLVIQSRIPVYGLIKKIKNLDNLNAFTIFSKYTDIKEQIGKTYEI